MKRFTPILLFLAAFSVALSFRPDHLHAWDALQLALSLEHFDMALHQPHPPGYLGPLALSFLFEKLGLSPDHAVQLQSVLCTALTASALFYLGSMLWGFQEGLLAALFFITNPLTLFYSVSGETYAAEALFATLLVLFGLRVRPDSALAHKALFFAFYGLSGGVRQSLPLFFAPFFAWRLYVAVGRNFVRSLVTAGVAVAVGFALWFLPLVAMVGGLGPLIEQFSFQFFGLFGAHYSPLMGAPSEAVLINLDKLWRYTLEALSVSSLAALPVLLATRFIALRNGPFPLIFLFWILPGFLWFVLMFVAKSGHLLFMVPAMSLASARTISQVPVSRYLARGMASAAALAQISLFLAPPKAWISVVGGRSLTTIQYFETLIAETVKAIRRLDPLNPERILVVTVDADFSFRQAMYYLPEVKVLWLMDRESTGAKREGGQVCEAKAHKVRCLGARGFWTEPAWAEQVPVVLEPDVRYLVWFYDEQGVFRKLLMAELPLTQIKVGRIARLEVTDLWATEVRRFRVGPYVFFRAQESSQ